MGEDAVLSAEELLRQLARLHQERRTGIARIATPDNQLLQVAFSEGEIVAVTMGLKHNLEAIKLFSETPRTGRLKFSEGKPRLPQASGQLPSTAAALRMLGLTDALAADVGKAGAPGGAAALAVIEREAVEFLGPMASIVWEEQFAKVGDVNRAGALQKLIELLAQEIAASGDAEKAKRFRSAVAKKLSAR